MREVKPDKTLDVRGLYCPVPIFKARKEMDQLPAGGILEIISDDPQAKEDLPQWARRMRYEILRKQKQGYELTLTIKKPK